jgi:hypothetical protein
VPPATNHQNRLLDLANIGPQEVNLSLLQNHINDFLEDRNTISPESNFADNTFETKPLDFERASILVIEGTYIPLLSNLDFLIFINLDYKSSLDNRINRGRESFDPFVEKVLDIEHHIITEYKTKADIIVDVNYKIQALIMPIEHSRYFSVNIGHTRSLTKKLNLDYGLGYVVFQLVGPGNFNVYHENTVRDESTLIESKPYKKNDVVKTCQGLEPRISMALKLNESQSIKIGYNQIQQFIHLLSNTMAISPADIWKKSNQQLPQQIVDQYTIGYVKDWNKGMYESSIEAYCKNNKNVIDYVDGAELYLNPLIETQLLVGKGNAYGAEFFFKKVRGVNLTGWISYTYAKSFRQVNATPNQESANFGLRYPSNFISPNNFKFVLNDRLTNRISFNANFTYATGRPITYPNGRYKIYVYNEVYDYLNDNNLNPRPGFIIQSYGRNGQTYYFLNNSKVDELLDGYSTPSFSLRNSERIPDYIRLDLGITLDPKPNSKSNSSWNFPIYNVLGRQNVYSIYFKSSTGLRNQARTYKLSILRAVIPSLTYNFKFQ